jgi:molybdopterin synthase sulfur carrier subunit
MVRIKFVGASPLVKGSRTVSIAVDRELIVHELLRFLGEQLAIDDLEEQVRGSYMVVVNGTSISHLQGWETRVQDGSVVTIVSPIAGG